MDVVGGGLHRLVAVAPTTVRAGESFDALVKAEDVWGNPCERFDGEIVLRAGGAPLDGLPPAVRFKSGDVAVARLAGLRLSGESRIVAAHGEHRVESNLMRALAAGEAKTWWG